MGSVSGDWTRRRWCLLRGQQIHGRGKKLHSNSSTRHADRSISKGMSASTIAH